MASVSRRTEVTNCNLATFFFFPGWAFSSLSQPVPLALEINLTLLPLKHLTRVSSPSKGVLVAGRRDQLLWDIHPCHHWHGSLLCLQPENRLEGVKLQPACEGDAGGKDHQSKVSCRWKQELLQVERFGRQHRAQIGGSKLSSTGTLTGENLLKTHFQSSGWVMGLSSLKMLASNCCLDKLKIFLSYRFLLSQYQNLDIKEFFPGWSHQSITW